MSHIKRTWFRLNGHWKYHREREHGRTVCGLSTIGVEIQQTDHPEEPTWYFCCKRCQKAGA